MRMTIKRIAFVSDLQVPFFNEASVKSVGRFLAKWRPHRTICIGIDRGALKNAVLPYLSDLMRKYNTYFRIEDLTHGNKKKADRITWSLQGRFEHGKIIFNDKEWVSEITDELLNFPNTQVHDDLIDALSYIDQIAIAEYATYIDEDNFNPINKTKFGQNSQSLKY